VVALRLGLLGVGLCDIDLQVDVGPALLCSAVTSATAFAPAACRLACRSTSA